MKLPLDPNLPLTVLPQWPQRLTEHLTRLLRQWAGTINQMLGPGWEDLRFPATGINLAGSAAAPTPDNSTWFGTLLFSGSAQNDIAGNAQMPHGWRRDSAISPHVHWFKTAADAGAQGVIWRMQYCIVPIGGAATAWSGTLSASLVAGDLSTSAIGCMSVFGDIDMAGYGESTNVLWHVWRAGDADSYTAAVALNEFDIHYQHEKAGTPQRVPGDF